MVCSKCGHTNDMGSRFCSSCGSPLPAGSDERTMNLPLEAMNGESITVEPQELIGGGLLVVTRGPNSGSKFEVDKPVVSIGRHPDSDIFLDDVTVSRRHVEITRDGESFRVSDAGSLNGTYLNRERIEVAELATGDELQVGTFRLLFLTGTSEG